MAHQHGQSHRHHAHRPTYVQDSPDFHVEVKRSSSNSGSSSCTAGSTSHACVFPTNNSPTLPIVLGILIPLGCALVAMIYLHRRNKKRQRIEDANDKHASLDFGLGEVSRDRQFKKGKKGRLGRPGRQPEPEMMDLNAERAFRNGRGMSMDMGSPYVLPDIDESRPSFNSISRGGQDSDDPYSPVAMMCADGSPNQLYPSRTPSRMNSTSGWTQSSDGTSRNLLQPSQSQSSHSPLNDEIPNVPEIPKIKEERSISPIEIPQPAQTVSRKPLGDDSFDLPPAPAKDVHEEEPLQSFDRRRSSAQSPHSSLPPRSNSMARPSSITAPKPAFDFQVPSITFEHSPSIEVTASEDDRPRSHPPPAAHRLSMDALRGQSASTAGKKPVPSIGDFDDYETYADVLGIVQKVSTDPIPGEDEHALEDAYHNPPDAEQHVGLGVYGLDQDNHRLSASLRPLPPDDPSDNPEARANRIRSFYREYFDEQKQGGPGHYGGAYYDGGVDYHEDYGQEYLDGATVFDPETGQFIVTNAPYAEPITRRAMTPPPRAPPRFGGRGGDPRHHGSGSYSASGQRSRNYSTASGYRGRQRKPMPPPAPLTNLPTPHLLKDDSAIFSAIDFAPPSSYRDRAAGRPDSPFADQKPYSPSVRAYTPLASPFDDLTVMPSPHHLRKSGTFTALDFAPPPRLKADGASDAGSIRSGRSNMSASQLASIRAGAYRVSRIPKELAGTRDDLAQALRPTWEQRGPEEAALRQ